MTTRTYKKFPYRTEYPHSSERGRSTQSLEDALRDARWTVNAVWRETNPYGEEGEYLYPDAERAVITNRNTGYRWILRHRDWRVEFQTAEMFEEAVGRESIDLYLSVEEAEALARAAMSAEVTDKRQKALRDQALDQIALLCRQVRARVRAGDEFIDPYARGIPRRPSEEPEPESDEPGPSEEADSRAPDRPPDDVENLSLAQAAQLLGKAKSTVYGWYRKGKFPPAVDLSPYMRYARRPAIVVPRYRLEAWQVGERMRPVLQEVFEFHGLREPPWVCLVARKGARRDDIAFWVERRGWTKGVSKDGRRIYGEGLEEGKAYDVVPSGC